MAVAQFARCAFAADRLDQAAERLSFGGQPAVHGAPVDAQAFADMLDGAVALRQQADDQVAHAVDGAARPRRRRTLYIALEFLDHGRVGVGQLLGGVLAGDHHRGEGVAELHMPCDRGVGGQVGRRGVDEAHQLGRPALAQQTAQGLDLDRDRHVLGHAAAADPRAEEGQLQHQGAAPLAQADLDRGVLVRQIARQGPDGVADGAVLAHQQPQRSQHRQAHRLAHQEAEVRPIRFVRPSVSSRVTSRSAGRPRSGCRRAASGTPALRAIRKGSSPLGGPRRRRR